jgi:TRAP-type C4-dicarboxylate transport system substrate-binding protein
MTGHVYTPAYITVGLDRWNKLDPEVQTALEEAAKETRDYVYATAAELDVELLKLLKVAGMEVNEPDKAAFIDASGPIYEEFALEVKEGKDMVAQALALADGS